MNPISGRISIIIGAVLVTTAALIAAQDAPTDKGEQLMNGTCISCHDIRPIQISALDVEGWNSVVGTMVDRGATIAPPDIPVLVGYLAKTYGPLPDGAGKAILLNACTLCHDLSRVKRAAQSRDEWQETLGSMLNEGAMLSDQDLTTLLDYLAKNFGAR